MSGQRQDLGRGGAARGEDTPALTELRLTRMVAEWLIAWANERPNDASRYPIPAWADSQLLARRVFAMIELGGVNTRSKPS